MKRMNSSTLSSVDDLAKYLVLDPFLGFHTKKMTKIKINFSSDRNDQLRKIIDSYEEKNQNSTVLELLEFCQSNDTRLLYKFNVSYKIWIENQIKMYLNCLSPQSTVSIVKCKNYTSENNQGVAVVAKIRIKANTVINDLKGIKKYVSEEEVKILKAQGLDFSIMSSTKSKLPVLLLGAAALLNHHCSPNCAYKALESSKVVIETIKDIEVNEELFCFYSSDYFDDKNINCECTDCKKKNINKTEHFGCITETSEKNYQGPDQFDEILKLSTVTSFEDKNTTVNTIIEKNSFQSDDLFKLYFAIQKFREFIIDLKIDEIEVYDGEQRRVHSTSHKGLKYDNSLYSKFIKFLKSKQRVKYITEECEATDDELAEIVHELYSNNHVNNYRSIKTFIKNYRTRILSDIQEKGEMVTILAPEFAKMEDYFYELTKIMISTCYKEFGYCIYEGKQIPTELKEIILKQLIPRSKIAKSDRTKLDNTLAKYKNYLRSVANKVMENVITETHNLIKNNQPTVNLTLNDLSIIKDQSIKMLENSDVRFLNCSVNMKLDNSLSDLNAEQIRNIIGV